MKYIIGIILYAMIVGLYVVQQFFYESLNFWSDIVLASTTALLALYIIYWILIKIYEKHQK